MNVIGLNINHHGSSVALIIDGKITACLAEERLDRVKNSSSFPISSLNKILFSYSLKKEDIDFFCINSSQKKFKINKIFFILKNFYKFRGFIASFLFDYLLKKESYNYFKDIPKNKLIKVDHHKSHIESAFLISPFAESVSLSLDGCGDFKTGSFGFSKNNKTKIDGSFYYPNSLGLFYQSLTQFIGFKNVGDEYKMMGLSAYGSRNATLKKKVDQLISYKNLKIFLNEKYFSFPFKNIKRFMNKQIIFDDLFSEKIEDLLNIKSNTNFIYSQSAADLAYTVK
jgi:carbamoyltransferase